ncbi:GtrA family protein [Paenibacillus algorifonticola]|uniref:GtrA family protein n=1 Tax=Paenibacillus algorifonticola TaxID=684063 RepID=UPI003D2BC95D
MRTGIYKRLDRFRQIIGFGLVGLLNTVVTYFLYLALLSIFNYSMAYSISYIAGIVISYVFNTLFVFKQPVSIKSFLKFPVVYIVQYLLNLLLIYLFVEQFHISDKLALIISIFFSFPITYVLSKYVLVKKKG